MPADSAAGPDFALTCDIVRVCALADLRISQFPCTLLLQDTAIYAHHSATDCIVICPVCQVADCRLLVLHSCALHVSPRNADIIISCVPSGLAHLSCKLCVVYPGNFRDSDFFFRVSLSPPHIYTYTTRFKSFIGIARLDQALRDSIFSLYSILTYKTLILFIDYKRHFDAGEFVRNVNNPRIYSGVTYRTPAEPPFSTEATVSSPAPYLAPGVKWRAALKCSHDH